MSIEDKVKIAIEEVKIEPDKKYLVTVDLGDCDDHREIESMVMRVATVLRNNGTDTGNILYIPKYKGSTNISIERVDSVKECIYKIFGEDGEQSPDKIGDK